MPDSSAIDAAVVAVLAADAELAAAMPDGVWMDEAPPGSRQFVIVSLVDAFDRPTFGQRAAEEVLYLVKAVSLGSSGANARTAAARIDVVLEDQPITVAGYGWMACHRVVRVRTLEVDAIDPAVRWHHRGGHYRVQMAVPAPARSGKERVHR